MNETYAKLGMKPADILLPRDADMSKWAVVACDQFTSQPEYWEEADRIVGDAPSTLRLILPESKLNDPNVEEHIADINRSMEDYLARDIFKTCPDSIIYIQRTQSDGKVRHGLVAAADQVDDQTLAQKGLILRKQRGPCPVHRHRAAAPEAALRIKVAKSVFPGVQIGDLGTEQAVVFVGIGGKARRRYFGQVAFPAAHVAHILDQLDGKDG